MLKAFAVKMLLKVPKCKCIGRAFRVLSLPCMLLGVNGFGTVDYANVAKAIFMTFTAHFFVCDVIHSQRLNEIFSLMYAGKVFSTGNRPNFKALS